MLAHWEQRLRLATTMSQAADDADLPADPEFPAALIGHLEWGTRVALANSQPDAQPVVHAHVPRWGWGVAHPDLLDGVWRAVEF